VVEKATGGSSGHLLRLAGLRQAPQRPDARRSL